MRKYEVTATLQFYVVVNWLITFMLFHVPCHMTNRRRGARIPARYRVKATLCHTYTTLPQVASLHKVFVTF